MSKGRKPIYAIGDVINGRQLIRYEKGKYYFRCLSCQKTVQTGIDNVRSCYCRCQHKGRKRAAGRFSGLEYDNSTERLEEIKRKYSKGVTSEILEEFLNNL